MKDNVEILLKRREHLREKINKMEKEYRAIGEVLNELFEYKQKEKEEKEEDKEYIVNL